MGYHNFKFKVNTDLAGDSITFKFRLTVQDISELKVDTDIAGTMQLKY